MKKSGLPARKLDETFTYGHYRQWPDDERWELIDGVAWAMAAPSLQHQTIVLRLSAWFHGWFEGKPCRPVPSPFDVLLAEGDEDADAVPTVRKDLNEKLRLYERHGLPPRTGCAATGI